ncbi:VWA domain-containing protein [Pseudenhygromyxa sp. WMMC2535]|uniref:vWA domain-containing protein n=1 Tax=Pseudenhygromyxa sp. WMMC2535 TaxID=2712867 RepID=UPI0015557785|nr:vWA domain-containing protein [Pseudenhygromyxa sp. WMMC2535]NVB38665.1 VWA domain-containing protein [Pseudenhygromyxa sp. WMMC2535]
MDFFKRDGRAARPRGLAAPWLLACMSAASTTGCADPCVDDGLGQKYCPEDDATDTGSGADAAEGDELGTGQESGDDAAEGCPSLNVILIPQTPTMVLLVDQSGSMDSDFGSGSRWTTIQDVLAGQGGIVQQFAASIRFGLTLYSSMDGNEGGECPMLTEVAPALDNFTAIESTLLGAAPIDETPTGESLGVVADQLAALDLAGGKYIVLATDGEPDTCAEPNPQNGQQQAVDAATAAYQQGIETFVISVGDEVSEAHLQDMANAGRGVAEGDADAPFYQALDEAALISAFEEIVAGVRTCRLDLDASLSAEQAADCTVRVNGDEVGLDDADGWQVSGTQEIELLGAACDALQQDTSSVRMECACAEG